MLPSAWCDARLEALATTYSECLLVKNYVVCARERERERESACSCLCVCLRLRPCLLAYREVCFLLVFMASLECALLSSPFLYGSSSSSSYLGTSLLPVSSPSNPGVHRQQQQQQQHHHHQLLCRASASSASILSDLAQQLVTPGTEKPRVDPRSVVSIILGGGAGTRLFPLTKQRAKPAVPIGGAYRLIDVPMSNCINSGINKVFVLTQFNSQSLNRHLARTYSFGNGVNFGDGFVEVLAATQRPGEAGMNWFQGTADAVRQFTWLFEDAKNADIEHVLILSGDHLYRMDYMDFVQKHKDSDADITISCVPIDNSRASDYGLMKIDSKGRVLYFAEKPKGEDLKAMEVDTTVLGLSPEAAKKAPYIASMGVYVFKKDILLKLLRWRYPTANDFGSEIIPASAKECNVKAYLFDGYWEDIGTIRSFYEANLALTAQPPNFSFYDAAKPIYTSARYLPPTKVDSCKIVDSIISHGCFLRECSVEHSIVGIRSRIENGVDLKDTVMLGADYYETDPERAALLAQGKVPVGVGDNSKLRNCIIDKNARIGKNVVLTNSENVEEADRSADGFYIRSGLTVVLKNSTIKDGTVV